MQASATDPDTTRPLTWFAVLAATAIGAVLRVNGLGARCLWVDEALSYAMATFPSDEILEKCAQTSSTHPPLYFLLLRYWMLSAGDTEFLLRLPAALLGMACIPLAFLLVRSLMTLDGPSKPALSRHDGAAILFSWLVALNPTSILAARQVRGYTLGVFLWLSAGIALAIALSGRRDYRWMLGLFVLFSTAQCYTHHVCILMVISQCVFLCSVVFWRRSETWGSRLDHGRGGPPFGVPAALATCFCIAGLYLPWAAFSTPQAAFAATTFERSFVWKQIPNDIFFVFTGTFARRWRIDTTVSIPFCAVLLATTLAAGLNCGRSLKYMAANALIPISAMLVYSMCFGRLLIHTRYLIFPATAELAVVALLLTRAPRIACIGLLWLLSNAIGWGLLLSWDSIGPTGRPGMRSVAREIIGQRSPDAAVYTAGPVEHFKLVYYLRGEVRPRLVVTHADAGFWGRRYVRAGDVLSMADFHKSARPGDWFVTERHRLSVETTDREFPPLRFVASMEQEFRWEDPVRLNQIAERVDRDDENHDEHVGDAE